MITNNFEFQSVYILLINVKMESYNTEEIYAKARKYRLALYFNRTYT